ncbi:concanavalin A-like lectin/glucanase domain-containing protein, partial [Obelidium mucronatum]
IATSTLSLLYGSVEATIQQSTIGGAVTYLTLISDISKDEIDYEWIGNERNTVWTNFFYRGRRERDPITLDEVCPDNSVNSHTYRIDWYPDAITWYIDGQVVRTQFRNGTYERANEGDGLPYDHYHYPNTPMTINFGIWNYQGPTWANGPIDWTNKALANGVTAKISNLKVTCYNGLIPVSTDPIVVPAGPDVLRSGPQTVPPPTTTESWVPIGQATGTGSATSRSTGPPATLTALPTKAASSGFKSGISVLTAVAVFLL